MADCFDLLTIDEVVRATRKFAHYGNCLDRCLALQEDKLFLAHALQAERKKNSVRKKGKKEK